MAKSIIEQYNDLFKQIGKAITYEDMTTLFPMVKAFVSDYATVDEKYTDKIYSMFVDKMQSLLEENDFVYNRMNDNVNEIRNRQYDYTYEKDNAQAVQNKVLQIMAMLPNARTTSNANKIKNILNGAIASGMIGSKAVLELMKYPAYASMIDETMKQHALVGSKSPQEQAFDRLKETELKEAEQALTSVYMQGFHLRKLNEKVTKTKTIMAW